MAVVVPVSLAPGPAMVGDRALGRPLIGEQSCSLSGEYRTGSGLRVQDSYLVDSASSHMLVSKIKPCMSKYKQLYRETANGSLNQLSFI